MNLVTLLSIIATLCIQTANAAEPEKAGEVIQIRGAAFTNHRETSDILTKDMVILVGDHIVTGHNTRVALKMTDGAILTLGADTEFAINNYSYLPQSKQGSAALELIKGVFRAVTGGIGKLAARDFRVKTSVGTIGIRGTDFWGGFYFSQALDVALIGGKGIYVDNAGGHIEINKHGDGVTVQAADQIPSTPKHWGDKKINAAMQSVSFENE